MSDERQDEIFRSSVPLCRIGDSGLPSSAASGCLVDYAGKKLLLSVAHATGDFGDWAIQLRYDPSNGTKLYRIGPMNFLAKGSLKTRAIDKIDYSYAEVPKDLQAFRQIISDDLKVCGEYPVTAFPIDFDTKATSEDVFGFSGLVKNQIERHTAATILASELKIYDGLKYLRTEGDMLVFKLPFNHPGHPEFEGCSGAPIINGGGMPVALLSGGVISKNEIYGVSLAHYRLPIDILVGY